MPKPARLLCLGLAFLLIPLPAAATPTSGVSRWLRGTLHPFFVPRWLRPEVFRPDPTNAMVARCAALEGTLPPLEELAASPEAEAFGQAFIEYLERRFGRPTVERLRRILADTPWIGAERAVAEATEQELSTLWRDMLEELREAANRRAAAVRKAGETRSTLLAKGAFAPRFLPDGHLLYWENGQLIRLEQGKKTRLLEARELGNSTLHQNPEHLSLTPDGRFLFLTLAEDCFRFDLETKELRKLSVGKVRAVEAAPGGDRLLAIPRQGTDLLLLDADGTTLKRFPLPGGASDLAWAPDGSEVALSLDDDLALLDPESGKIERIRGKFQAPSWSPDSRWLFCSSARSGIFNLYALYRETGFLYRVTNVVGGAFQPAISPDFRRIAFLGYSAQGTDLCEMPLEQSGWRAVKPSEKSESRTSFEATPHRFQGSVGWGLGTPRPSFDLSYRFSPLGLRVTDDSLHTFSGDREIWQRRQLYEASLTWNESLLRAAKLTGGYRYRSASLLESAPGPVPGGSTHLLFANYALEDTFRPPMGISPEEGRVAGLSLEHALSGAYDRLGLDGRFYRPLGDHRVLALRAVAGLNVGSPDGNFRVGGELGPELGSLSLLPLRGYPVGILSGAQALSLQADVRFPLCEVQRGLVGYPVSLSRLSGAFFWEGGTASDRSQDFFSRFKQGVGGEIQGHTTILDVRFDLRLGMAYGLASDGGWRPYFSFNTPF